MQQWNFWVASLLVWLAILLSACGATGPVVEQATSLRSTDIAISETATPTVAPTETAIPPTATHTSTTPPPTPTLTPTFTSPVAISAANDTEHAIRNTPDPQLSSYETTIVLPTYPFTPYLVTQTDPLYNLPVLYLNRPEYEDSDLTPREVAYQAVVLENRYLRLTFLPELGGRLYSALIKATAQEVLYHNPVVKPSVYGPLAPIDNVNPNWWLAVGGMEWAYPVQEHGYRWGVPWQYEVTQQADRLQITLTDDHPDGVSASVTVSLAADEALFTVEPTIINHTAQTVPVQFWTNAALALNPDRSGGMSANTEFILPVDEVIVHSRGHDNWSLPEGREPLSWPQFEGYNLRNYYEWAEYLGVFIPYLDQPFMAAYNPSQDLGMVRLIEPGTVAGSKLFAFSESFPYRNYTDDNSQYFELWGGLNEGFWPEDDLPLEPGQSAGWQEQWWPLAGLPNLSWANQQVAVGATSEELALTVARPLAGEITVLANDVPLISEPFTAQPDQPLRWPRPDAPTLQLELRDAQQRLLLSYRIAE